MKNYKFLLVITFVAANAHSSIDGHTMCKHAGMTYAYAGANYNCPDYSGDDVQLQSGWIHHHGGNNEYARSVNISDPSLIQIEDPGHCTITKEKTNQHLF